MFHVLEGKIMSSWAKKDPHFVSQIEISDS